MKKLNKKPKISVILPTYNEVDNIIDLVFEIHKVIIASHEIIVVDDNSPDGTSQAVRKQIKQNQSLPLRLITRKSNRGLTNSIWEGILAAKGEVVIWMDCDFSHPPRIIPKLVSEINKGYDIAVASRFIYGGGYKKNVADSNDSILAVLLSRIMNYAIQFLLIRGFKDYTSGFIAIRKEVFNKIKLRGDYGEYFIDLMVRAILAGYLYIEIPFVNLPRSKGESKTGSNLRQLSKRGLKYVVVVFEMIILRLNYLFGFRHVTKD